MTLYFPYNPFKLPTLKFNFEAVFLSIFWTGYFLSINVHWTDSWIASSFFPDVAPHTAMAIPMLFFMNVFWVIPKFLNKKKWVKYVLMVLLLGAMFELSRGILFSLVLPYDGPFPQKLWEELHSKNSLLTGELSFLTFNFFLYSYFYRFARDWIINQSLIEKLKVENFRLQSFFSQTDRKTSYTNHFFVKKRNSHLVLPTSAIVFFRAQGDFVLCTDNKGTRHIINDSLKNTYKKLDPKDFFQINRSEIVNIAYIEMTHPYIKNRLEIVLKESGQQLYTSNSRTPQFRLWLRNK